MEPQKLLLLGPTLAALGLLLFPRQAFFSVWFLFKWLADEGYARFQRNERFAALRQMLAAENPNARKDWFWQERWGAFLILIVLTSALYWI